MKTNTLLNKYDTFTDIFIFTEINCHNLTCHRPLNHRLIYSKTRKINMCKFLLCAHLYPVIWYIVETLKQV